jgi:nicotinate-nucleotide adenylyltransferase
MAQIALNKKKNIKVIDIENHLPVPSFTYRTLRILRKKYPRVQFSLIVGADVMETIHLWKSSKEITTHHNFIVKNRTNSKMAIPKNIHADIISGVLEVSATDVRNDLYNNKKPKAIKKEVFNYIINNKLYTK